GGLANFVVLANSKLTGFTAVSYFFTLTRDEPFFVPVRSTSGFSSALHIFRPFCNSYPVGFP
ncbi:hypothetical protein, partial [Marinobacter sp.]|uniref:hypothetical protein n=1 Tax=Marinobacter sp. TaxID=50741 RepID=UPI00257D7DF9